MYAKQVLRGEDVSGVPTSTIGIEGFAFSTFRHQQRDLLFRLISCCRRHLRQFQQIRQIRLGLGLIHCFRAHLFHFLLPFVV